MNYSTYQNNFEEALQALCDAYNVLPGVNVRITSDVVRGIEQCQKGLEFIVTILPDGGDE